MPQISASEVQSLQTGLASFLGAVQSQLQAEVYAESLPLIGTGLSAPTGGNTTALSKLAALQNNLTKADTKLKNLAASGGDTDALAGVITTIVKDSGFTGTVTSINGGEVVLDFSQVLAEATAGAKGTFTVKMDAELALPGLGLEFTGPAPQVQAGVGYDFNFKAGLNNGSFYIEPTATDAIAVGLKVESTGFKNAEALMNGLPYLVSSAAKGTTMLQAQIGLGLNAGGDGRLTGGELGGNLVNAVISAGTVDPALQMFSNLVNEAALPGIGAQLNLQYNLAGAVLDGNTTNNQNFGSVPTVAFNDVGVNSGTFIANVVQPFAQNIVEIGGPIFQLANYLVTPLPEAAGAVLKQFGLGNTLIDVLSPEWAGPVKRLAAFGELMQTFAGKTGGGGKNFIDLGSFTYATDGAGRDIRNEDMTPGSVAPVPATTGTDIDLGSLKSLVSDAAGTGGSLSFPILQTPGEAYKLLLGAPANLVLYDPAEPIDFSFDATARFAVFPGVFATLGYGAGVKIDFSAGYDTSGIAAFAQGGFDNPELLLNGFFLGDAAGPELMFDARFEAGVEVGLPVIFTVGLEGGIRGHVELEFVDDFGVPDSNQDGDGKVNYNELKAIGFDPFRAFTATGKVEAFLSAYLDSLFYSKHIDLGSYTLFDFATETKKSLDQPTGVLAQFSTLVSGQVEVNVGINASRRLVDNADGSESIRIDVGPNGGILVSSVRTKTLHNTALPAIQVGAIELFGKNVFASFNAGDDVAQVSQKFTKPVSFFGGFGDDLLSGGAGPDSLYGGEDNDRLNGGGGGDVLFGDAGNDQLSGGEGADYLAGGYGRDILTGGPGNDSLYAVDSLTTVESPLTGVVDRLYGNEGNDTLVGSNLADILDGGSGADTMITNGGADSVFVDHPGDKVLAGTGADLSQVTIISRGVDYKLPAPFRTLFLSNGFTAEGERAMPLPINATGNDLDNVIYGNASANHIIGGKGNDIIYGDGASDYGEDGRVIGGIYIEGIGLENGADRLEGGQGNDQLYGRDGNDVLIGGPGQDTLEGGYGDDILNGLDDLLPFAANPPVADLLKGGPGNDIYYIDALDIVSDSGGTRDVIILQDGVVDLINYPGIEGVGFTGAGNATGDDGPNFFFGGPGKNVFKGLGGADVLQGGAGDLLEGGSGDDTYIINEAGVKITEVGDAPDNAGDEVQASISFELPLNVEVLRLLGIGNRTGIGNLSNNLLFAENEGSVTFHGGDGDDDIYSNGDFSMVAHGGYGDDEILGSAQADTLYGFASKGALKWAGLNSLDSDNDTILGGDGNDLIYGGMGSDLLDGQNGDDQLHTEGGGAIIMRGGEGNDRYYVDFDTLAPGTTIQFEDTATLNSQDTIYSLINFDMMNDPAFTLTGIEDLVLVGSLNANFLPIGAEVGRGNNERNRITGNLLDNTLDGRGEDDILDGGLGDDLLIGGEGRDLLLGGPGDDTLDGVTGDNGAVTYQRIDTMRGGPGNDTYLINERFDRVEELANEGIDTVLTYTSLYVLPAHVENLILHDAVATGTGNELANVITGSATGNLIHGEAGDDTIFGHGSNDLLHGDTGNDQLYGGQGQDELYGGAGNDILWGHDDPKRPGQTFNDDGMRDLLYGGAGKDKLFGQGGNDVLDGGLGDDTMEGGEGSDTYYVDSVRDQVIEPVAPPLTSFDRVYSSVTLTIPANVEQLYLIGLNAISATGSKGGDELHGNDAANRIYGLANLDEIYGHGGDDQLYGGDDTDYLYGGEGNDLLDGGNGGDSMTGGPGDDTFIVSQQNDHVFEDPDEGFDTVRASLSFTLPANVENLTLVGTGKGTPTVDAGFSLTGFVLTGNSLSNRLVGGAFGDKLNGGAGADLLIGGKGSDLYVVDHVSDRISEKLNEGTDLVRQLGEEFSLPDHVENLHVMPSAVGSDMTDFLVIARGNSLPNEIRGNNNACVLEGRGGNDKLFGGSAADQLYGGFGDDVLDGGTGGDLLDGGPGNDLFLVRDVFATIAEAIGGGKDRVESYVEGFTLPAGAEVEELALANLANVLSLSGNEFANRITGNSFNNTLGGGGGSDILDGGLGDDNLYGSGGFQDGEIDRLTGGKGADHFFLGGLDGPHYAGNVMRGAGTNSLAHITDFKPSEGDRLVLPAGNYVFGKISVVLPSSGDRVGTERVIGLGLFLDLDADGVADVDPLNQPDDLIALLGGFNPSTIPSVPSLVDFLQV